MFISCNFVNTLVPAAMCTKYIGGFFTTYIYIYIYYIHTYNIIYVF